MCSIAPPNLGPPPDCLRSGPRGDDDDLRRGVVAVAVAAVAAVVPVLGENEGGAWGKIHGNLGISGGFSGFHGI